MRADPREQFGREAEKYVTSSVHADSEALRHLIDLVNPSGGTVVDVGTGAGHTAFAFAPHVENIVALDPTPQMLEIVARHAAERRLQNLRTQLGFAEELPFETGSVDGVTCRVAAHHFDSPEKFVDEVFRVLKSGGWFLLVDTVSPEDDEAARQVNVVETIRDPSHRRNWKISEWKRLVQSRGMHLDRVESRFKTLRLQEWMDRMSVAQPDQDCLRGMIRLSSGSLRDYFQPGEDSFCLQEMTLVTAKSDKAEPKREAS